MELSAKEDLMQKRINNLWLILGLFVLLILTAGCGDILSAQKNNQEELSGVKFVRQIVTQDNTSSRAIMWQSDEPIADGAVEYRQVGENKVNRVGAKGELYTDDGQNLMLYTARLENLPAGDKLEYRLIGNGQVGKWHNLSTDDGGAFTALIFPDSQSSDYSGWQELAKNAAKRNPEAKFFVNMGDLVDNGEDHSQWEAWFNSLAGTIDRIPVAPIMGNHETYNRDWQVREPVAYLNEFAVPDNGSSKYGRYYYSYDYGSVHFIVLNTQLQELKEMSPDLREEQLRWFRQDVANSQKPWKVVLMHRDALQYRINGRPERQEGFDEEGLVWMTVFEEMGVDAVLSAHLHTYRNRGHIRNFQHDASGPLYILTGVAGNVRYPNLWLNHALDEYVAPQPETANYMTMQATENQLDFYCYLPDGTELDHEVLKK